MNASVKCLLQYHVLRCVTLHGYIQTTGKLEVADSSERREILDIPPGTSHNFSAASYILWLESI